VTGLAATLMHHYPEFQFNPALMRAHLMATALGHDGLTGNGTAYGTGRVSGYLAHWDHDNNDGWLTHRFWGNVNAQNAGFREITVPPGTQRLVVVMTWDEPPASAGASRALLYDLDLWLDHGADCGLVSACGDFVSQSRLDSVEYVIVNNPPAGTYWLKVDPYDAPGHWLPYAMVAHVVRGNPTPVVMATMTGDQDPRVGEPFDVRLTVSTPAYIVSGAQVELTAMPSSVTPLDLRMARHDGVTMNFDPLGSVTLGNLVPLLGRTALWTFRATSPGPKTFRARVWSENGGEVVAIGTVSVVASLANLAPTEITMSPATPVQPPGTTIVLADAVENAGAATSRPSTTRYYLSLDPVKNAGDTLMRGTRSVPALAVGAVHSGTVKVTIPTSTPAATYFLLACADDRDVVEETDDDNCLAAPGTVTVALPDLVANAVSNPPATVARRARFPVTDTAQNPGPVGAGASKARYYLSLDQARSPGDRQLAATRNVPALAAGASHSGTVKVTIPAATPPGAYFVLACADALNTVAEINEANNCTASSTAVTVTP
jgi:hypothetical protein